MKVYDPTIAFLFIGGILVAFRIFFNFIPIVFGFYLILLLLYGIIINLLCTQGYTNYSWGLSFIFLIILFYFNFFPQGVDLVNKWTNSNQNNDMKSTAEKKYQKYVKSGGYA